MKRSIRIPLTQTICPTCGQPTVAEATEHGGFILIAPMVIEGARSWSCDNGTLTLEGKPITREALAALLASVKSTPKSRRAK